MEIERLKALIVKEFIQVWRDKITLTILIFMPITQLLIFGFAINTDIKHLPTAVFDQSRSRESREMTLSFSASNYFDIVRYANSMKEVNRAVESGEVKVGVIFPPDYSKKLNGGRQAQVQVIVDATDNMSASSALAAAQMLDMIKSHEISARRLARTGITLPEQAIDMRIRPWYNPDFITSWYIVPGIMGLVLTLTLVSIMAIAIVRESEQGTLEQLLVTPMRTWELLFCKILPYIVIGYIQVIVAIIVGVSVFNMPFLGSMPLFFLLTLFYVAANLALGIMISTLAQNQMQAMQLSIFIILPSVLLSGFVFPVQAMPVGFQLLGKCFPITHYISLSRQIILKGGGLEYVRKETIILCCYIAFMFSTSIVMFKKRFEP